jgi:peptidoglycan/xylan/chitin deacetylase (PgdA/CDA1 family)
VNQSIPILMYHSVSPEVEGWAFKQLSLSPEIFEDHLAVLSRAGYESVLLSDVHAHVSGAKRLSRKSIALTFDDGYLDNWVFAFPLLKKYGFRATIFVSTDFVDPRNSVRPTLEDAWRKGQEPGSLDARGFLSGAEIAAMVGDGTIDIQAHCRTHTWYFTGDQVIDFHHPDDGCPWLAWNARPERKYLYMEEDQMDFVPLGSPIYTHDKALVAHRYFPDPSRETELAGYVGANGGRTFFDRADWRRVLMEVAGRGPSRTAARYETEAQRSIRLREEIWDTRKNIETLTGRPVEFLCWPGGAYDDTCVQLAREAGYKAWTVGSHGAIHKQNIPAEDPAWMRRIAVAPWWQFRGRRRSPVDGEFLRLMIEGFRGAALSGVRLRWYKLGKLFRSA